MHVDQTGYEQADPRLPAHARTQTVRIISLVTRRSRQCPLHAMAFTPNQPLRAATKRQVGSCCDRSRSNVHRSVISVTASVPVMGRPFLSWE